MRPKCAEAQIGASRNGLAFLLITCCLPKHPAQIFQTTRIHWVAFKIEEKIARIGQRQLVKTKPGLRRQDLVKAQSARRGLLLQARLLLQSKQNLRSHAGYPRGLETGKLGERRHAGLGEIAGLPLCDISDAAEVVGFFPRAVPDHPTTIRLRNEFCEGEKVS